MWEDVQRHETNFDVLCTSEFSTDKEFLSREELTNWIKNKGRSLGYVIVTKRSKTDSKGVTIMILFQCDRGGVYNSDTKSSKNTGTRKIDCPFRLLARFSKRRQIWTLSVKCDTHNHDPTLCMEGHPYAARLTADEAQLVDDLLAHRVKPRNILSTLKNLNPDNAASMQTIYNARNKSRMSAKEGRTQMQILISFVERENYFYLTRTNNLTNELEDLFFAHPISLDLWRAFPNVMLMDATYKTNRYNMPFFEIVGVTSTNMTFCIAFVYMCNENESTFYWALHCLKSTMNGCICPRVIVTNRDLALIKATHNVFPDAKQLLCSWHISESVMRKSKKKISEHYSQNYFYDVWHRLVRSPTEEEYSNNLKELQTILKDYQGVLRYLNDTWLNPFKEMFVSVWIDKFLHFGNHTTNRVESQHAKSKKYLGTTQLDLQSSLIDLHYMIQAQETHIKASFKESRSVMKHRYKLPQFQELHGSVSIHAMDLLYKELQRCNDIGVFSENCGCQLRTSHGLPCAHEQALYYSQNQPIPLDSIDLFWRKLDFAPCTTLDNDDIGCEAEVKRFTDNFNKQSRPNKLSLLRKLKEIVVPSTTSMREPVVQKNTRGRPFLKDKLSRKLHVDSSFQEPPRRSHYTTPKFDDIDVSRYHAPARHSCYVSRYQATTSNVDETEKAEEEIDFIDQFEPILRRFIKQVQNVKSDENCGFRAIAACLDLHEDNWPQIRRDLLEELNEHRLYYDKMFNPEFSALLETSLSWFEEGENVFAPITYLMTMPNIGVLIASKYDRILHVLSKQGSITYLPLRTAPRHWTNHFPIAIGFVNGNHYVKVSLEGGYPMPTIYPQWFGCKEECAEGWITPYLARIKQYTDYIELNRKADYDNTIY